MLWQHSLWRQLQEQQQARRQQQEQL